MRIGIASPDTELALELRSVSALLSSKGDTHDGFIGNIDISGAHLA